jgi:DNA-directed RNA polymerase subunit M/transcription elongation factor TFIIS
MAIGYSTNGINHRPVSENETMAKASPEADKNLLRFRCNQCGSILRIGLAHANRYIDCPKCKNRTHVPANQKIADEEARDYGVNKLAFDTTGECRNCKAKMTKKAVVCVKCGFDYRTGKVAEVVDKTKLPSDYPTWPIVFKGLGSNETVNGMVKLLGTFGACGMISGLLGVGITVAILWFIWDGFEKPPVWPYLIAAGVFVLTFLALAGLIQEILVEVMGRVLYGKPISAGMIPVAALYFLGVFIPAWFFSVLILAFVAIDISAPPEQAPFGEEPNAFNRAPVPVFALNQDTGIASIVATVVLTVVGNLYLYFGVGSYATDLTINPINIFRRIGRCGVDVFAWLGIHFLFVLLATVVPAALYWGGMTLEIYPPWVILLSIAVGLILLCYTMSATAHMTAHLIKRRL